jgi:hypothetical protein
MEHIIIAIDEIVISITTPAESLLMAFTSKAAAIG